MKERIIFISIILGAVLIFAVLTFIFLLRKGTRNWTTKVNNLQSQRINYSKADFINYYKKLGFEAQAIEFVYCKVQDYIKAKNLTLLPTDDFISVYEIDEEEWKFPLKDWFKEINQPFPDTTILNL